MTTQELAATAAGFLTRLEVSNGTSRIVCADGSPEWVRELCRAAHGEMFPDDWRYEFIQDALQALAEGDDADPDVDSLYPYTADRLRWLSSRLDRSAYCDEYMEETGGEYRDFDTLLACGMYWEMREVWSLVRQWLEERVEATADAE